jgi:translation elongation factor EF-G
LRIRCAATELDAVNADLLDRDATITSCEVEAASCHIEARAPLASLLGYRSALERLTGGSAKHAIWLSHYAPMGKLPPPGGHAA